MEIREEKVPFVHLHLHTEYSLLDGATRLKIGKADSPLIESCLKMGMRGCAVTDHGNMMAAFTEYELAGKYNKKIKAQYEAEHNGEKMPKEDEFSFIFGCEFYTADSMTIHDPTQKYNHLILLAKNDKGLKNLIKLTSEAYLNGFYSKPRIDLDLLEKHSEGLVCLSACIAGRIPKLLLANDYEGAKEYALKLQSLFEPGDFYIEIQDHGIPQQKQVLPLLVKLAREIDAKVVATNDVHYLKKEDSEAQDILMCISTGAKVDDPRRLKHDTSEMYLKSYEEMLEVFGWIPEALTNTVEIFNKCKGLFFKEKQEEKLYPAYHPDNGMSAEDFLIDLTNKGLKRRYGDKLSEVQINRAKEELYVIHTKGFDSYYLVVWDFINFARQNDIPVGPGRGSGVSSIVAYAIGITNVEPLQYDLLFERFLNPERNSPPDFDIDICTERRGEVIDYVVRKYGRDRVCQILTLGTLKPKNAIRDVARVYNVPLDLVNRTMKTLPNDPKMTLTSALNDNHEFREIYEAEEDIKKVVDMARRLEGWPRNCSMHAAGVVICNTTITDEVPLQLRKMKGKDVIFTQFQKGELEAMGVLKMDFLGLITLTDIHHAIKYAEEDFGVKVDFDELGYSDPDVFKMIADGDTDLVFQLENGGMRKFMTELKPNCIEDLIAGVSLYRPGPMDKIPEYLVARQNPDKVVYYHECLKPILEHTYGFFVYQEQVMNAARVMSTYSLGEADNLRRCMGKKDVKGMAVEKIKFLAGAKEKGISEEIANTVFADMEKFASYAFNKSHAAAYAVVAYQTAYMKKYYYVEFVTAVLNNRITKTDQLLKYLNVAKNHNISIFPPSVNNSRARFNVENQGIRFGLTAIKNIGEGVADEIYEERVANGDYKTFEDFIKRLGPKVINKSVLENLIKAGAMDCFGYTRATLMSNYNSVMKKIQQDKDMEASGQISMFDIIDESAGVKIVDVKEYDHLEILAMEKEVLNMYMSGHPLEHYKESLKKIPFNLLMITEILNASKSEENEDEDVVSDEETLEQEVKLNLLIEEYDKKPITMGGILDQVSKKKTKSNAMMCTARFSDEYGSVTALFFSNTYEKYKNILQNDAVVRISGTMQIKETEVTIMVRDVVVLSPENEQKISENVKTNKIAYVLADDFDTLDKVNDVLKNILDKYVGDDCLNIQYRQKLYKYPKGIAITDSTIMQLQAEFGHEKVKIV